MARDWRDDRIEELEALVRQQQAIIEEQRAIIARLNERFAREEASGALPEGASPRGFRLLHGCELEIRADGLHRPVPNDSMPGLETQFGVIRVPNPPAGQDFTPAQFPSAVLFTAVDHDDLFGDVSQPPNNPVT